MHGANFGHIDVSTRARLGETACGQTEWLSATIVTCRVSRFAQTQGTSSAIITVALSIGTQTQAWSADMPSLAQLAAANFARVGGDTMTLYGSSIAQVSLTAKAASGHTSCESTVWMSETTLTCSSALEVGASMIMPQMPTEARPSSKVALPALGRSPSFVLLSLNGNIVSDLATRPPACDPRSMARRTMAHEPRSFNSLAAPTRAPISQDVVCSRYPKKDVFRSTSIPRVVAAMAVSKLLSEEAHNAYIMLSGFHDGMQMATDCRSNSGSASCGAVTSQDLVLADGEAGSNHHTLFRDLRGVVGHAHWDASTMSVKMHLARDAKLQPFQPYVISVSLKNAPQPSEKELRITAFDGDGQCVVHSDDADDCIGQELLSADMHFGVCVPEFMTADVSQGHGLPGCNGKRNNITIYLQTNVELKSSYTFTISGLHVSNVQYETGFGYDAQVSIAETASESEIHVAGENFTADAYEIIVSALNTGDAEEYYSRDSLTVSATAFDNPLSKSLEELTGMEVEAVDMTASIRQSSPCPFAINTLTFEMQTNVVLPVGATITISGLTKTSSHTPTLDLFSCSTSSSSESMLSKEAAWNAAPLGSAADRVIVCGS